MADHAAPARKPASVAAKASKITSAPRAPMPRPPWHPPANRTGLPDRLKSGLEALSGLSMDDVRVHRNSPEPASVGALAYARGSDIHLGPGQEQHLPHEAWHVVQQKQGRVIATRTLNDAPINEAHDLEAEADVMGRRATARSPQAPPAREMVGGAVVQRKVLVTGQRLTKISDSLDSKLSQAAWDRLAAMDNDKKDWPFADEEALLQYLAPWLYKPPAYRPGPANTPLPAPAISGGLGSASSAPRAAAATSGEESLYTPPAYRPPPQNSSLGFPAISAGPGAASSATHLAAATAATAEEGPASGYVAPIYRPPLTGSLAPQPVAAAAPSAQSGAAAGVAAAPAPKEVGIGELVTSDGPMYTVSLYNCVAVVAARQGRACLYHWNTIDAFTSDDGTTLTPNLAKIREVKNKVNAALDACSSAAQGSQTTYHIALGIVWRDGRISAVAKDKFVLSLKGEFTPNTFNVGGYTQAHWNPPTLTARD